MEQQIEDVGWLYELRNQYIYIYILINQYIPSGVNYRIIQSSTILTNN